ncbi:glycosyl transferase family 90-domain-containing protein [Mycena floridula]|nr:glycosyl transferase family 90-domain-containing protein [Mycena floridula]
MFWRYLLNPFSRLKRQLPHYSETDILLPPAELSDDELENEDGEESHRRKVKDSPVSKTPPRRVMDALILVSLLGILACLAVIIFMYLGREKYQHQLDETPASTAVNTTLGRPQNHNATLDVPKIHPEHPGPPDPPHTFEMDPETYAQWSLDALLRRQPTTLAGASARYTLKTGRPPPRNYDQWFNFARDRSCLIDEYDQIHRDFEPFYQLAEKDPKFFKRMIEAATKQARGPGIRMMKSAQVRGGTFKETDETYAAYNGDWERTFGKFVKFLPDMDVLLNGHDEPRVLFNPHEYGSIEKALQMPNDPTPFGHRPSPTSTLYFDGKKCILPMKDEGFASPVNEAAAFLIDATATDLTLDMYPILSMTKVSPCFSDILVPSEVYYQEAWWSPKYAYPNNIPWEKKKEVIYWRGRGTGGHITGQNYRKFSRFRAFDIARTHTDIMDIAITDLLGEHCGGQCDGDAIRKEYNIQPHNSPREEQYQYKYLLDLDGNSFSSRYLGLLRSGSLVFKSTLFSEFFNDWLRPYVHYIPVLVDLSDLTEKIEWAIKNDAAARRIQETGRLFAEKVMTDNQNDCYFAAVLLEWGRLWEIAQTK